MNGAMLGFTTAEVTPCMMRLLSLLSSEDSHEPKPQELLIWYAGPLGILLWLLRHRGCSYP